MDSPTSAPPLPIQALLLDIHQRFSALHQQRRMPGLSYGVVSGGGLIAQGAFGLRDVEANAPVLNDSIFRIASMTKSVTAMAVLRLRDAGLLRLDAPAADYVPELAGLAYPTSDAAPITIRQLLTMNAGLPEDNPWGDRQLAVNDADFTAWLRAGLPFANAPGLVFEYSNYNFAILGRAVANVSGIRLQDYASTHILAPLGMTSTFWERDVVPADRLAYGYRHEGDGFARDPILHDGAFSPMGGLFTTIADWARYMAFLIGAFPARDDQNDNGPIRRSSAREMQQIQRFDSWLAMRPQPGQAIAARSIGYGFGLAVTHGSAIDHAVAHGGGLPGYGTYYMMLPNHGVGILAFSNLRYGGTGVTTRELLEMIVARNAAPRHTIAVTAPLTECQTFVSELYHHWEDARAQAGVGDNFFLDTALEKRRDEFAKLHERFGAIQAVSAIEPENRLRGEWKLVCERGTIRIFATLTPTFPIRLQALYLVPIAPLSSQMRLITQKLLRMIGFWDEYQFRKLFGRQFAREKTRALLEAARVHYGALHIDHVREGDGTTRALIRLIGQKAPVDVAITIDPKAGKIVQLAFMSAHTPLIDP